MTSLYGQVFAMSGFNGLEIVYTNVYSNVKVDCDYAVRKWSERDKAWRIKGFVGTRQVADFTASELSDDAKKILKEVY